MHQFSLITDLMRKSPPWPANKAQAEFWRESEAWCAPGLGGDGRAVSAASA
jgi:hypothetical protein